MEPGIAHVNNIGDVEKGGDNEKLTPIPLRCHAIKNNFERMKSNEEANSHTSTCITSCYE